MAKSSRTDRIVLSGRIGLGSEILHDERHAAHHGAARARECHAEERPRHLPEIRKYEVRDSGRTGHGRNEPEHGGQDARGEQWLQHDPGDAEQRLLVRSFKSRIPRLSSRPRYCQTSAIPSDRQLKPGRT